MDSTVETYSRDFFVLVGSLIRMRLQNGPKFACVAFKVNQVCAGTLHGPRLSRASNSKDLEAQTESANKALFVPASFHALNHQCKSESARGINVGSDR